MKLKYKKHALQSLAFLNATLLFQVFFKPVTTDFTLQDYWIRGLADWFTAGVGLHKIPMYVHMYPLMGALVALYAAKKAYSASIVTDNRERDFRREDIERKEFAYLGTLIYELWELDHSLTNFPSKDLKEHIDSKNFLKISEHITKPNSEYFFMPTSLDADWDIHSCIDTGILHIMYQLRTNIKLAEYFINEVRKSGRLLKDQHITDELTLKVYDVLLEGINGIRHRFDEMEKISSTLQAAIHKKFPQLS